MLSVTLLISKHSEDSKAYDQIPSADSSSAFDCSSTPAAPKTLKFRNALIINWFLSPLSSRSQQVKQFNLREFPSPFHLVYYWLLR